MWVRPRVNTKPAEDKQAGENEKIIAVTVDGTGCLVSIRDIGGGDLVFDVVHADQNVRVRVPGQDDGSS